MVIPEAPFVLAGGVAVFEGEAAAAGVFAEAEVFGIEVIFSAAELEERGCGFAEGFGEGEEVVRGAAGAGGAEDEAEGFLTEGVVEVGEGVIVAGGDVEGAGEAGGGLEGFGLAECPFEGAVAAHGESGDGVVAAGGGEGEEGAHEGGEFLMEEVPVGGAVGHVGVEAAVDVGHDDGDAGGVGIAFDAGAAGPDRVVVGEAVEEPEAGPEGAGVCGAAGADLALAGGLGDDDGGGGVEAEGFGEEVAVEEGHRDQVRLESMRRLRWATQAKERRGSAGTWVQ